MFITKLIYWFILILYIYIYKGQKSNYWHENFGKCVSRVHPMLRCLGIHGILYFCQK